MAQWSTSVIRRKTANGLAAVSLLVVCVAGGCGELPSFPVRLVEAGGQRLAFDVDGDGREDYWQDVGPDGRKTALHFDDDGDGVPDATVRLDDAPTAEELHVVIILDGVPFEVIEAMYGAGHFRLFAPPSRLISVFPAMTDVALARVFRAGPCLGYEALYYDQAAARLSNGNDVYMSGRNAPWTQWASYRCGTWWDILSYLDPAAVWRHELGRFAETIAAADSGVVSLYTVATAGLGTRGGRQAIVEYLETVEALCERVTYRRRGKVRFTLLADHGHGLTPCRRVDLKPALRKAGFRVTDSIRNDTDVVIPSFGIVTSMVIHTPSPRRVAEAIADHEAVDLVMYRQPRRGVNGGGLQGSDVAAGNTAAIIVRSADGNSRITRATGGYRYQAISGDPLRLLPVLDRLRSQGKVADDGGVSDRDWFEATAAHDYPDALHRIWSAFEAGELVENPADVLVSLKEGFAGGSGFFSWLVRVKSTHGALSRRSSTAFIMSSATDLPPALRVDDVADLVPLGKARDDQPTRAQASHHQVTKTPRKTR